MKLELTSDVLKRQLIVERGEAMQFYISLYPIGEFRAIASLFPKRDERPVIMRHKTGVTMWVGNVTNITITDDEATKLIETFGFECKEI